MTSSSCLKAQSHNTKQLVRKTSCPLDGTTETLVPGPFQDDSQEEVGVHLYSMFILLALKGGKPVSDIH